MRKADLLFEIGTEELPPLSLKKLAQALLDNSTNQLKKLKIGFNKTSYFATPRRLAILITQIDAQQKTQKIQRKGPHKNVCFDKEHNLTAAALGFAKSCGVDFKDLKFVTTDKGEYLFYTGEKKGKKTSTIITDILINSIKNLPVDRMMRWGDGTCFFVRPVHWVLLLFDNKIINSNFFTVVACNKTYGHRYHAPDAIEIKKISDYKNLLKKSFVIADFNERRNLILEMVTSTSQELNAQAIYDDDLLDEITAICEYPCIITGHFPQEFLAMPAEVLITTMQKNQKYFALRDKKNNNLINSFITIANIKSQDPSIIRAGNEKVILPRLQDARFFWEEDKKIPLEDRIKKLKNVTYIKKIGSLYDKTKRVEKIAKYICKKIDQEPNNILEAARLYKCDLITDMVVEFPSLQGVMGSYYAKNDGKNKIISEAIYQSYLPRFASDNIPNNVEGCVLSVADKIDTICAIFSIKEEPTGTSDPYAVRRSAIGIIRILIEEKLFLNLYSLISYVFNKVLSNTQDDCTKKVMDYFYERLKTFFITQGYTNNLFYAILNTKERDFYSFYQKINATDRFIKNPYAKDLVATFKRVTNITKNVKVQKTEDINEDMLQENAEKNLYQFVLNTEQQIQLELEKNNPNYSKILEKLSQLKPYVDNFFNDVMVNCEDIRLKNNRLLLLYKIYNNFIQVADLSYLDTE
jgi:glycyl-tRNA synthetase beta chain